MALPPRTRGWIDRPDARIYYEKVGEGPPIVFAHGLGGSYLSWYQQVAFFARRYTCIAFSHRGFFPSTAPETGVDPTQYAGDVAALVDQLGLGRIRMVCQSMGGWSGVEYALSRPGQVQALVLAATTGSLDHQKIREPERGQLATWATESAAARAELVKANVHQAAGAGMAALRPDAALLYAQIDGLSVGLDKEGLRARMHAMRIRPPADLAKADCPVLFIPGGRDVVIPPQALTAMGAMIPGARVAAIPEAGHSAYFECPAAFNALVDAFFAEVA